MKVLILGAQGNLGYQLMKVFSDYDATGLSSAELDVTNEDLVLNYIEQNSPEIIINAAAYNAVDKCEQCDQDFEIAQRVNADALAILARGALSSGATLVHYSTDYVFGGEENDGYIEDSVANPINKYGLSKLAGEKNIIEFEPKGLKYYIIRTSRLFGPQGVSVNAKPNFFDVIAKKIKEQNEVSIVDDERGSFAYSPHIAEATRKLILGNNNNGVYHITNSGSASWYEAAVELKKALNIEGCEIKAVPRDVFPRPAKIPKNSVLKNTKLDQLGSWQDALREYLSEN